MSPDWMTSGAVLIHKERRLIAQLTFDNGDPVLEFDDDGSIHDEYSITQIAEAFEPWHLGMPFRNRTGKGRYGFERVHTMTDYYDAPREGIADFHGRPHHYSPKEPEWWNDGVYELRPIDDETFELALEHWTIWRRWEIAFHEGRTDLDTHPALPGDRARLEELEALLAARLPPKGNPIVMRGLFHGRFFGSSSDMHVAWVEPRALK